MPNTRLVEITVFGSYMMKFLCTLGRRLRLLTQRVIFMKSFIWRNIRTGATGRIRLYGCF